MPALDEHDARLATVSADGVPHLVPLVFAVDGDVVLSAVDGKPKRHRDLRRLRNIADHPAVCLLVDHYDDEWSRLWWVRADGHAAVHDDPATLVRARDRLAARYEQHRERPPDGPVVVVTVTRWSGWAA